MIPIFDNSGNRLAIGYNSYSLNVMEQVEGAHVGTKVTAVAPSNAIDYISDKLQWKDGIEVYGVTKGSLVIVINGIVYGGSEAGVADRSEAISTIFDPGRIVFYNSDPFIPLTYSIPTNSSDYPTGLKASKIFVMPLETPLTTVVNAQGFTRRFRITLLAKDPLRYLQTAQTLTNGGTLTYTGTYPSYPTISIPMTAAGGATAKINLVSSTRQGTKTLVLNLSGASNGDTYTVDFARQRVLKNGTETQGIYVSGDWWKVEPGSNTINYTDSTGLGTRTLTVYPAFPA